MFRFSPKYLEIISIAIVSCFTLGVALVTIQENLLYTRWLDLGLFPSNDAEDYVQQSSQYLLNGDLHSNKGRIIFPIIYSGLLAEFKLNVKAVQLSITFLTAIITFLSSFVIYQKYGFLCSMLFSRDFNSELVNLRLALNSKFTKLSKLIGKTILPHLERGLKRSRINLP